MTNVGLHNKITITKTENPKIKVNQNINRLNIPILYKIKLCSKHTLMIKILKCSQWILDVKNTLYL